MDTCIYLGIYPHNIESASEDFARACERFGIDEDGLWECVHEDFRMRYGTNFGNVVIAMMFEHLASAIEATGVDGDRLDYYVNGIDSHFTVDEEEV